MVLLDVHITKHSASCIDNTCNVAIGQGMTICAEGKDELLGVAMLAKMLGIHPALCGEYVRQQQPR